MSHLSVYAGLVCGIIAIAAFAHFYAASREERIRELERESEAHRVMADHWWVEVQKKEGEKQIIAANNKRLKDYIANMQVIPTPPKPTPAPEATQLTADLKVFGIVQDVVLFADREPNRISEQDAKTIWTWGYEATKRVPLLETGIEQRDGKIAKLEELVSGQEAEIVKTDEALANCKKAFVEKEAETQTVRNLVEEERKKRNAETVRWWVKVTAGAVAGYVTGKNLR